MSQWDGRALKLHRKYGSNDHIVGHCETVAKVCGILVAALKERGVRVNEESVMMAALLHDIGRNRTQTVQHGFVGAEMVTAEGIDPATADIIRKHVGAGISGEEAGRLGFPEGDYVPRTIEEMVVCFADKMVDGGRVRPFEYEVNRFRAKGHDVERLEKLRESLKEKLDEDPEELVFSRLRQ